MKFSFWGESGKENTEVKPIKINYKWDYSPLHQGKIKLNMSIFQSLGLFKKSSTNKLKAPSAAIYDIQIFKLKGIISTTAQRKACKKKCGRPLQCVPQDYKIFTNLICFLVKPGQKLSGKQLKAGKAVSTE